MKVSLKRLIAGAQLGSETPRLTIAGRVPENDVVPRVDAVDPAAGQPLGRDDGDSVASMDVHAGEKLDKAEDLGKLKDEIIKSGENLVADKGSILEVVSHDVAAREKESSKHSDITNTVDEDQPPPPRMR